MVELTARQRTILKFIRTTIEKTGLPPTRHDICDHFGFQSPNAAEQHLRALSAKGYVELVPGASRGIRLLEQGIEAPAFSLPVIGQVAAGQPILVVEHIEDHYRIDPALFRPRAHYLLRVRGMSMRDAGIREGDLLAVHRTRRAENGQLVVVRIERDEVTVKQYRHRGHRVHLMPANPDFRPMELDVRSTEVTIEGRVVGVLRQTAK
jgi:repressor LexA